MDATKKKRNFKRAALGAFFLPFTLLLFAPLDNYLLSPESYIFSVWDICSCFIPVFLIAYLLLFTALYFLPAKFRGFFFAALFFVTVTLYIHGNYLNNDFGLLDGRSIDWDQFTSSAALSVLTIVICLAAVVAVVFVFRKKDFEKILLICAAVLIAVQSTTCIVQMIGKSRSISFSSEKQPVITTNEQFELSSKENVVIFIVDTLDTRFVENLISDDEFTDDFKDFTFFNNCVSIGSYTYSTVPFIVTGERFEAGKRSTEYGAEAYIHSEFLKELNDRNYRLGIYSEQNYLHLASGAIPDYNFANFELETLGKEGSSKLLCEYGKLIAFRYLPFYFKQFFVTYTGDINAQVSSVPENLVYKLDDAKFYEDLCDEHLSFSIENPVVKFYHLFGAHPPYTLSAEAERLEKSSRSEQIEGAFYIIKTFMDELKQSGMYDNTAIVITGDHGLFSTRVSTAVLIKRAGEQNESIVISNNAVSFENHFENTMMSLIGATDYGETMYDAVSSEQNRTVWVQLLKDTEQKGYFTFYEMNVQGKSTDNTKIHFTGNYLPELSGLEYHLGDRLGKEFARSELNGFSVNDSLDGVQFYGDTAFIPLYIPQLPDGNIRLVIELHKIHQFPGTVELYLNEQRVGRSSPDIENNEISFIIPHEMLTSKMLVLQLNFDGVAEMSSFAPDGIRPVSFQSIYLEESEDQPKADSRQDEMILGYASAPEGASKGTSLKLSPGEGASTWYINMPSGQYEIIATGYDVDALSIAPSFTVEGETKHPLSETVSKSQTEVHQIFTLDEDEKFVTLMLWTTDKPVEINQISIRKIHE